MGSWVWIGFGAFFVAALATGIRLVLLWGRTRELPELLIGIGVLGIGPLGFGFAVVGQQLLTSHPASSAVLYAVAILAMNAGGAAKFVFNWRVYHPERGWARAAALASAALLLAASFWEFSLSGFAMPERPTPASHLGGWLRILCLMWGSVEALRWFGLMRRRARLGLADAVVTNRFLLWGIAAGSAGIGSLIGTVVPLVTGVSQREIGWLTMSSSLHGLVAAVAMWLAFLPPRSYLRWIHSPRSAGG
jgi:hypothetical protein